MSANVKLKRFEALMRRYRREHHRRLGLLAEIASGVIASRGDRPAKPEDVANQAYKTLLAIEGLMREADPPPEPNPPRRRSFYPP